MKTIIISPYSKLMRNGTKNPKNYPYWVELVRLLHEKGYHTIQVGVAGEEPIGAKEIHIGLPLRKLEGMIKKCDIWISVDNFFHHLADLIGKQGFVLFGQSDPVIFGHESNINILKDREYLRALQFAPWEESKHQEDAFLKAEDVMKVIDG